MLSKNENSIWHTLTGVSGIFISMFLLRFALIKFLWKPLGVSYNISPYKSKRPPPNHHLEKLYLGGSFESSKNEKVLMAMAKQEGMTVDETTKWFEQRDKYDEEPDLDKFNAEGWLATFYVFFIAYGYLTLSRKSWFWKIEDCWRVTPSQNRDPDVVLYASIALAFYILESSILLVKNYERRDYYVMRAHHMVSGGLVVLFWQYDALPFCCVTLFLTQLVSPFPHVCRLATKLQLPKIADLSLVSFAVLWGVVRIFLGFYWLVPSYVNHRIRSGNYSAGYLGFDVLIFLIVMTNLIWSYRIFKKFFKVAFSGKYSNSWKALILEISEHGN